MSPFKKIKIHFKEKLHKWGILRNPSPKDSEKTDKHEIKNSTIASAAKKPVIIYLGIDYGTHFIKAAYAHPHTGNIHQIKFKSTADGFLPSTITIDEPSSQLIFCTEPREGRVLRNSKILAAASVDEKFSNPNYQTLKDAYQGIPPEIVASLLIAYATYSTKMAAISDLRKEYPERKYEFKFVPRVCIPVDYLENNPVKDLFEGIIQVAAQLVQEEFPKSLNKNRCPIALLQKAEILFKSAKYDSSAAGTILYRPEIVAELQSYIVSLERRRGIPHAVYDIGGGTTELTIFKINKNNTVSIYETKIIPQGTYLNGDEPRSYHFNIVPETKAIWLAAFNRNRAGSLQTHWRDVAVFLSGGGALIPDIHEPFSKSWDSVTGLYNHKYKVNSSFPLPRKYKGEKNTFNRMCVAYGLATSEDPDVLFPSQIKEEHPLYKQPINREGHYFDISCYDD